MGLLGVITVARPIPEALDTPQQPRIFVKRDGRPIGGVTLAIYRRDPYNCAPPNGEAQLSFTTDDQGRVKLPQLPPDGYYIVATAKPNLRQELCLNVTALPPSKPGEFAMNFSMEMVPYTAPPTDEELFAQSIIVAESSTDIQVVSQFSGTVRDEGGAYVPNGLIDVVARGTGGKKQVGKFHTDDRGRFSTDLPEGDYVGVFRYSGFRVRFVAFTISKVGGTAELKVVLQIGSVT